MKRTKLALHFFFTVFFLKISMVSSMGQKRWKSGLAFKDVAAEVGIRTHQRSHKFGGPCVADLDNDGIYDLVLSYHANEKTQVFFGNPDGTFTLSNFTHEHFDIHGVNVAHLNAHTGDRLMVLSIGGARGNDPKPPYVYQVSRSRTITKVTEEYGLAQRKGRMRSAVFMHITDHRVGHAHDHGGGPDVIFLGYLGKPTSNLSQFAYANNFGKFNLRSIGPLRKLHRPRAEVTDIDNDGKMEIIGIYKLQFYKMRKPFQFVDVSRTVMPEQFQKPDTSLRNAAVAEIDFDNDGNFDLYVARASRRFITNLESLPFGDVNDVLLRNVGGKYVDVSEEANIPKETHSVGVTAGDFNNDGFVDLLVILFREPDMILLNQGDGTFKRVDGLIPKNSNTVGDHAVAVDYDLDGRLDAVVGQGFVNALGGPYRLMKSFLPLTAMSNYLHVKVGNAPNRQVTSLHAVVTVVLRDKRLFRRVGSRGAQAGGGSYIDTVHFGLGSETVVKYVRVQWANLQSESVWGVSSNRLVRIGMF